MSVACAILLASVCAAGDGLENVQLLVRRGLLRQAEERLVTLLANERDTRRRAHVLLLLGNVDYERGHYAKALERYVQAERDAADEPSVVAALSGNRVVAEQRLARSREVAGLATRLRSAVVAVVILAASAVAWLAYRSRKRDPARSGIR